MQGNVFNIQLLWKLMLFVVVGLFIGTGNVFAEGELLKYKVLKQMSAKMGNPNSTPVQDAAGNVYGIAAEEGKAGKGAVYKIAPDGTYSTLHEFGIANPLENGSNAGIILGNDGSLYGAITLADPFSGASKLDKVYKIDPNGNFTVVHKFSNGDENYVWTKLTLGKDGSVFGVLAYYSGGLTREFPGKIFKISPDGTYNILHTFDVDNGANPQSLTLTNDGSLYGVTQYSNNWFCCGPNWYGTIFKIDPNNAFKVLHFFDGTWGVSPGTKFVLAGDGNLYGSTGIAILKIEPNANDKVSLLYDIMHDSILNYYGDYSGGDIILGSDNNFYGVSNQQGSTKPLLYKIGKTGLLTKISSLETTDVFRSFSLGTDDNFYAASATGGQYQTGSVLKINPNGSLSKLYEFGVLGGSSPIGKIAVGADGSLYGTNQYGGKYNKGTVYRVKPNGVYADIFHFDGTSGALGQDADGGITLASDGSLYGTIKSGGKFNKGAVYKIAPDGTQKVLHDFDDGQGQVGYPIGGLSLGPDGNLYGLGYMFEDGQSHFEFVYKITPTGEYSRIYQFTGPYHLRDYYSGSFVSGVVVGSDGSVYGSAFSDTSASYMYEAVIFKITPQGNFYELHNLTQSGVSAPGGALALDKDGALYGAVRHDASSRETIFKLDANGVFSLIDESTGFAWGASTATGVMVGKDGSLYSGIYKVDPNGVYSFIEFIGADVMYQATASAMDNNGALYYAANSGGANQAGLLFKLSGWAVTINDKATIAEGQNVTINILANDKVSAKVGINPASVKIVAQPTHGTVTVNTDGSVMYTPEAGFGGKEQFTYNVKDNYGFDSNTAFVKLNVLKAVDDSYTFKANSSASQNGKGYVSLNDLPKIYNNRTFTVVNNPARIGGTGAGTLAITAFDATNGNFTYGLTGVGTTKAQLQESKRGVFQFTYTWTLDGVTTRPARVTITAQ